MMHFALPRVANVGLLALALAVPAFAADPLPPETVTPTYRERRGDLADGTPWMIRVPNNWNGKLINDLDYVTAANTARSQAFMSMGYALSGTARHAQRRYQFDPARQSGNLIIVLDMFRSAYPQPTRVIQYGTSSGGNDALAIGELYPDKVDGVVAECPSMPVQLIGQRADLFFSLKALLAPNDDLVAFAGLPDNNAPYVQRWREVLTAAMATPQGRAKIALAFTIAQWPYYTTRSMPVPVENEPADVMAALMATTATLPTTVVSSFMYELQGAFPGNQYADYWAYFDNGDPMLKRLTKNLYRDAGLDLEKDLRRIQLTKRLRADEAARDWWLLNPARTIRGKLKVPAFRMHTTGDETVPIAQDQTYDDMLLANGASHLVRSSAVDRAGHCNFTLAEQLVALDTLERRLDSGNWPSATAQQLNARASTLLPGGTSAFLDYRLREFNGAWRLELNPERNRKNRDLD
jgi:pimeloyl-ACP methyl ester carboxylesterase